MAAHRIFRTFRREEGATDPILVIAAIAVSLVLLVGGSFAVSGMVTSGHDLNAQSMLDKVATAEAAVQSSGDAYWVYDSFATSTHRALEKPSDFGAAGGIGFNPATDARTIVDVSGTGWVATSASASGKIYIRTSASPNIVLGDSTTLGAAGLNGGFLTSFGATGIIDPGSDTPTILNNMKHAIDGKYAYDFTHGGAVADPTAGAGVPGNTTGTGTGTGTGPSAPPTTAPVAQAQIGNASPTADHTVYAGATQAQAFGGNTATTTFLMFDTQTNQKLNADASNFPSIPALPLVGFPSSTPTTTYLQDANNGITGVTNMKITAANGTVITPTIPDTWIAIATSQAYSTLPGVISADFQFALAFNNTDLGYDPNTDSYYSWMPTYYANTLAGGTFSFDYQGTHNTVKLPAGIVPGFDAAGQPCANYAMTC